MKKITDIVFGFSDAENYKRRENKDLFNQIFLRTKALDRISQPSTFFLVGEKGTGKTAYAVYYSNTPYQNNISTHKFIRDTDYHKFISLRNANNLTLSDYTDIWKVIIYLMLSQAIYSNVSITDFLIKYPKFRALKQAIDEYYETAFSPEIATALQFVENSDLAATIMLKYSAVEANAKASRKSVITRDKKRFQTNLLTIEREFQNALSSVSLVKNKILFIDGVDIRPATVPYAEYLDCVKGLANAVWSVNNDFFPSIRDSKGRMRVVLLLRPDIFNSLGLQNRNTKLKDNSAVLDWRTVYFSHRSSDLFKLADRMFSAQQVSAPLLGESWDHYFPFNATNVRADESYPTSFVALMRYSFHRPRDILTILDILKDNYDEEESKSHFDYKDLHTADFRRRYGDYLLGELKDSLSFYYNEIEFESFLKFFEYLDGKQKFDYETYVSAFREFQVFLSTKLEKAPDFMISEDEFLQFLYDQNILCYIEDTINERFFRWCFIERSPSNISPKVKFGLNYEVHYGLANVLNTGKTIKGARRNALANGRPSATFKLSDNQIRAKTGISFTKSDTTFPSSSSEAERIEDDPEIETLSPSAISIGSVKFIDPTKKYGFIVQPDGLPDVHFSFASVASRQRLRPGAKVEFLLTRDKDGRLSAQSVRKLT